MDTDFVQEFGDAFSGTTVDLSLLPFGVRHRVLRSLLRVTIDNIVQSTGIHPYTITRWEQHGGKPYRETREKLVDFWGQLGVPGELVEGR